MRGLLSARSRFSRLKHGQGMTEYIIIIAIVAIGAILIIGLFGKQIKRAFSRMGGAINGEVVGAGDASDLKTEGEVKDSMNSFDADASQ